MDFTRYKYFLAVAEELNIQKTAQRLFISQQALSTHIQKLEKEYDAVFFERRPKLRLTPAGEHMLLHCKRLMEVNDNMISDITNLSSRLTGKITVGIANLRGRVFLPDIWEQYHALHPSVTFKIANVVSADMERNLMQGDIDFYIGVSATRYNTLMYQTLASERLCCVMTKELLQKYGIEDVDRFLSEATEHFAFEDFIKLRNFPFVMMIPSNRIRFCLNRYFYNMGIAPDVVAECTSQFLVWQLSKRGAGIGFVSPAIMYDKLTGFIDENLCVLPIDDLSLRSDVEISYLKSFPLMDYHKDFIHVTKAVFRAYSQALL